MAKFFFLMAAILSLALWAPLVSAEEEKCQGIVLDMLPCLDYAVLGSNLTAPGDECCTNINKIVKADPTCLCIAADKAKDFNVNMTRARDLPKACKTGYNGHCSADSPPAAAPAPGPKPPVTAPPPDSEISPAPPVLPTPPSPAPSPASSVVPTPSSEPTPGLPVSQPPPFAPEIHPVQSPSGIAEGPSSASLELPSSLKFLLALAIATFVFLAV